ncbi:Z1 domain-containing protein [Streptomyces sp. BH097]|uniref:Z1 domain-containing protein n=1 Tax=unclassified Streptomyces TaxID=2593676 RepID=UPI003BB6FDD9
MDLAGSEDLSFVLKVAIQFLPEDRQATPDEVTKAVETAKMVAGLNGVTVEADDLRKLVESRTSTFQESSAGLSNSEDHVRWLPDAKNDRSWAFWARYERFLKHSRGMPLQVVNSIDRTTDEVLGELEDPHRPGSWRRMGLVIGQVQSGKTGQFIGLAAKAADAGYRLIVVFAGVLNDLRAQTQLRIDEGLLGFDTQYQLRSDQEGADRYVGVGAMAGEPRLHIASLTNSTEKGDFDRKTASKANLPIGNFPVVLVVKKHPKIIDYLRTWVTEVHGVEDPKTGRKIVQDIPLFVIDDEADNASVNTAADGADPTSINTAIRKLLTSFDKSSYVGYTATPYANIYIDPDADHASLGGDLFPESFIRTLRAPSNYLGPERLFGLRAYAEEEDIDPLPLVHHVDDTEDWIPEKHKSGFTVTAELPDSLRRAIHSFVLTCAARRARGQVDVHNSMLVHVTRFTKVQGQVRDQIDDYVRLLRNGLMDRYGDASRASMNELRDLWEEDFETTTDFFTADEAERLSWEQTAAEILPAIQKFEIKAINGVAKDVLDYYSNRRTGMYVIAVGGQKLSRGLTLEGLSVSYYLRFAKTYDTLLQMGRWFGYRPGYEDLCRLYTTSQLVGAYEEITAATDELRRDIEEMAAIGFTPRQFGLKVRTSSLGLSITAANKMRQGTRVRLSFSGELAETTIFPLTNGVPKHNFDCLKAFTGMLLEQASPEVDPKGTGSLVWSDIPAEVVASGFFDRYRTAPEANRIRPDAISAYIQQCAKAGELGMWTVRIVSRQGADMPVNLAGHTLGAVTRAASKTARPDSTKHTIKRILNPKDESLDLDRPEQYAAALEATKKAAAGRKNRKGEPLAPTLPTGEPLRWQRRPDQAHLLIYMMEPPDKANLEIPLIGFAASFPFSQVHTATEYVVNVPWWKDGSEDDLSYEDGAEDA